MMNAHHYTRTSSAYDACMSSDDVKTGDTLIIERERVVGLAWAWPLAVTFDSGELHTARNEPESLRRLLADSGITPEQVANAVRVADELGYAVDPRWREA